MAGTKAISNGDVQAEPSKAFFIDMLTRDITLSDSILDLVDNSTHSLINTFKLDVMRTLLPGKQLKRVDGPKVDLTLNEDEFTIVDNCGGIPSKLAEDGVFNFGRPNEDKTNPGLGVYGIGMKRALYKMGELVSVESTTKKEHWRVDIDVEKWKREEKWAHQFAVREKVKSADISIGTRITVRKLKPGVSIQFGNSLFRSSLLTRLGSVYRLFLHCGLEISVNGILAEASLPQFAQSEQVSPELKRIRIDSVDVLIIAGMSPRQEKTPHGWYVYCNGRLVLEADKSSSTGWGTSTLLPNFHTKYNHFLGMVYFRSNDASKLPWRTTKEDVDRDSPIYQKALQEMAIAARPIINKINQMYSDDLPVTSTDTHAVLSDAKSIDVNSFAQKHSQATFRLETPKLPPEKQMVNILYQRSVADIEKARKGFGRKTLTYKKIGEKTFDYFLEKEGLK